MKLGFDNYSLRWQGWDAFQQLEYAATLGLDNIHYSDGDKDFQSLDEDYLRSLKRRADELGLSVEVGTGSFDQYSRGYPAEKGPGENRLSPMLRAAKTVGSPSVRCFLGSQAERQGSLPIEAHIEECLRVLRAVAPQARDLGVKVAVENHGGVDLLARELEQLVVAAGTDFVGVCLDSGNPVYAAEDPVVTAEVLAPYTVTSHIRDTKVWACEAGAMAQWAPMGGGSCDLKRITALVQEKAPNAVYNLEIITGSGPATIPYNDPESAFWRMFPNMLARDFARFAKLAAAGEPKELDQLTLPRGTWSLPPGETGEQLRAQQRRHLEESLRFAREELGIGERGR